MTDEPAVARRATARTTHERVLDAAVEVFSEVGWAALSMGKVADRAGVSRQTVYNEVGTKAALAAAMVGRELGRFLDAVDDAFAGQDDLREAVRAAAYAVFTLADGNRLLHATLAPERGGNDLLPLIAVDNAPVISAAAVRVEAQLGRFAVNLTDAQRHWWVDAVVRLTLSHLLAPRATAAHAADEIAWAAARIAAS